MKDAHITQLYGRKKIKMETKILLDRIYEFKNSDISTFIESMVGNDISYFTDEKIKSIEEYLHDTGWTFYGKYVEPPRENRKGFFFAAFGSKKEWCFYNHELNLIYRIGKRFDLDDDIKKAQKMYDEELEEKEQYRKYEENKKEYWRERIANMSTEEIVNILVDLSTNEDNFDHWKYDEYYYEEEDE